MNTFRIWLLMLAAIALAAPGWAEEIAAPQSLDDDAARTASPRVVAANAQNADQGMGQDTAPSATQSATQNATQSATQSQSALPDDPGLTRNNAHETAKPSDDQESHERVLGMAPNYDVVNNPATARALTVHDKFRLFYREAYDPYHFVSIGVSAGIGQARDDLPEVGQGAEGYGKRYGTYFADSTLGGFFGQFLLPSLLHEDPRYFRQGSGTIRSRLLHAAGRSVITRRDDGTQGANYSNFLSGFLACSVGNAYYPEQERGAGITLERGARHLPTASISAIFSEFWPDIHNMIFKKKK